MFVPRREALCLPFAFVVPTTPPHNQKKTPSRKDLGFSHLARLLFVGAFQVLFEPTFECHLDMASFGKL